VKIIEYEQIIFSISSHVHFPHLDCFYTGKLNILKNHSVTITNNQTTQLEKNAKQVFLPNGHFGNLK